MGAFVVLVSVCLGVAGLVLTLAEELWERWKR